MPSLDSQIFAAIQTTMEQSQVQSPAISVEKWDAMEAANDRELDDYCHEGGEFMSSALKTYVSQRALPRPIGSYDVIKKALFGQKTLDVLMHHAGVDVPSGRPTHLAAFCIFIGAALEELGHTVLTTWFDTTFGPLVTAAEEVFAAYYYMPYTFNKASKRIAEDDGENPHKRRRENPHRACDTTLDAIRKTQPRIKPTEQGRRDTEQNLKPYRPTPVHHPTPVRRPSFLSRAISRMDLST
ncbi:hypothetical protein B0H17DRAFT_1128046 [Mycena rosella]|uniref:Uncharacterized protein n=1 Tax=Mycena rosella TaxID=1033263 RepID=A0AAD7E019_MYCRO|nr:hypothetical protein B0H17DRAFT_1128046 [Mycena rosella]